MTLLTVVQDRGNGWTWAVALAAALVAAAVVAPAQAQLKVPNYLGESGTLTDRYLSADELRGLLHEANERFGQCFAEHMGPGEAGDVTLTMTVGRDGRSVDVRVEIDEKHADVGACLEAEAALLEFPSHDGDPVVVGYPIVYLRDQQGNRTVPYPVVFIKPRERPFLLMNLAPTLTAQQRRVLKKALYP